MKADLREINKALEDKQTADKFSFYPRGSSDYNAIQREMDDKVTDAIEGRLEK